MYLKTFSTRNISYTLKFLGTCMHLLKRANLAVALFAPCILSMYWNNWFENTAQRKMPFNDGASQQ